jgi:hypothetical protein
MPKSRGIEVAASARPILRHLESASGKWLLLGIALLGAIPRLYLGATQFIEYDGYWHVFIATQDDWQQFRWDYNSNFHPPLFYLLLKVAIQFGRTRLVYRAISLAAGTAAIFVIGQIAKKISRVSYTPAFVALAYGIALPSIIISCEVRSYMLSVFFVLVSFSYFLDLLQTDAKVPARSRMLFALNAILAGYSHYGAFFYVFACGLAALLFYIFLMQSRLWNRFALDLATFGVIAAALAYVFFTHAQAHAVVAEHLHTHYFQGGGQESLMDFLLRNSHEFFNLFSPLPVGTMGEFYVVLAVLVVALGWLIYLIRHLDEQKNALAAATVVVTLATLASIMASAVIDKYPFGGELRQQFFLFPFTVLCGSVLLDRVVAGIRDQKRGLTLILVAVAGTASAWSLAFARYPKMQTDLGTAQMNRFRQSFPVPAAVFVDQFNLINFFTHYHDWNWHFMRRSAVPGVDTYNVRGGNFGMLLFRDKTRWNLDFGEPALYRDFSKCIRFAALPSLTVYAVRQVVPPGSVEQESQVAAQIISLASAESLCVRKLVIQSNMVFGEFKTGKCATEIDALTKCRQCDDTNWSIAYSGNWVRSEFENALNGTLTYAFQRGASIKFSFEGAGVTYVYTRAFNRGMAAVFIDGAAKGVIDLYSPKIEWQSTTTFDGLKQGPHSIEIRVTGQHSPASNASYVDLDALLVR